MVDGISVQSSHGHKCDHVTTFLKAELKLFYIRRAVGEKTDFSQGKMGL